MVCTHGEGPPSPLSVTDNLQSDGFTAREPFTNDTTVVLEYRNPDDVGDDMFVMDITLEVSTLQGNDVTATVEAKPETGPKETFTVSDMFNIIQVTFCRLKAN